MFTRLFPQAVSSSRKVFWMRWGDSKRMMGISNLAARLKKVCLPFLRGGNPRKQNSERLMSLTEIIAESADGPGIGIISKSAAVRSLINFVPGSEMLGVPASVTKAALLNLL